MKLGQGLADGLTTREVLPKRASSEYAMTLRRTDACLANESNFETVNMCSRQCTRSMCTCSNLRAVETWFSRPFRATCVKRLSYRTNYFILLLLHPILRSSFERWHAEANKDKPLVMARRILGSRDDISKVQEAIGQKPRCARSREIRVTINV
jgi:hypothetical protein